jgi:2-pyrone-4,6-dicarboxylate lactonase
MSEEPLLTTALRAAETLQSPRFAVPAGTCDAHMHVFGPEDVYPRVPQPHYTLPGATLRDYLRAGRVLGIDRFVIVQPSFYGTDNSCLLDALRQAGDRARGVVMFDPEIDDSELERFHAAGVRGVRLDLFKRAREPLARIHGFITAIEKRVARLGWHLQFYSPGYIVRDLIPFLGNLQTDFVIDHMGYMLEADGLRPADFSALLDLTRDGRCWLKLSGPYRLSKSGDYKAVEHIATQIVDAAPDRALWGSDWPHLPRCERDTGELINLLSAWAPEEGVRNRILVDNPRHLFGFA